jgi:small subunit ribosomal protein S4
VFSLQLREKQKLKRIYGMRERQFRRFVDLARRESERTGTALLRLLERRLDNVVYRLGFARSRAMARQLVVHGHVLLNGRKADVPSLLVEPGMEIGLGSTARSMPDVRWAMEEPVLTLPGWLSRDNGSGRVIDWPAADELEHDVQDELIVEFYSR